MGLALIFFHHKLNKDCKAFRSPILQERLFLTGREVGRTYIGDSQTGGSLPVDNFSKSGLVLHDTVRNTHLSAQCRQKKDELQIYIGDFLCIFKKITKNNQRPQFFRHNVEKLELNLLFSPTSM